MQRRASDGLSMPMRGLPLAHCALARILALQGNSEEAKATSMRARFLAGGTTRRERQHVEATAACVAGQRPQALGFIKEHLAEFPLDAFMLDQAYGLIRSGCQGGGGRDFREEHLALLTSVAPVYGEDWFFLGHYSFAHHELDMFEESRRLADRSLAYYPRNTVAFHSLAHVFYETADHSGGVDFLASWMQSYDRRAPAFIHLSWHRALFELAMGHYEQALALYDDALGALDTSKAVMVGNTRALEDIASLLWRCEVYRCTQTSLPWEEVRDLATSGMSGPGGAFSDVHAALACAGAKDDEMLGRLLEGLRNLTSKGDLLATEVTLPLVQGIAAFSHSEYEEAVRYLEPLTGQLRRLGGSYAQLEVFEDTLLEAYLRASHFDRAEKLLRRRLGRRSSARDLFWLGRAQAGKGTGGGSRSDPTPDEGAVAQRGQRLTRTGRFR